MVSSTTVLKPTQSSDEVQKANANIQHIIRWKEANKGATLDSEMRSLLHQWDRLKVEGGTLLRRWKPASHLQPQFQVVLTREQGQEILKELHSKPTGGHLGIKMTAAKVQQQPRWVDNVEQKIAEDAILQQDCLVPLR